jgi:ribose transport system substrate-binding protein
MDLPKPYGARALGTTVCVLATLTLILTACASSSSAQGTNTTATKAKPTIAVYLPDPPTVTYTAGEIDGLKEGAAATGLSYSLFNDNSFTPADQYSQVQDGIDSGKYNTLIVHPTGANLCTLLQNAIKTKHLTVINMNAPICAPAASSGSKLHTPGTLTFIGGNANYTGYYNYWKKLLSTLSGSTNILSATGPVNTGTELAWVAAQKAAFRGQSSAHLDGTIYTDYTTPTSLTDITDYLQGHPKVTTIVSMYVAITEAAVQAVKNLGLADKIKVYDVGGDAQAVGLIKSGSIVASSAYFPASMAKAAMEAAAAHAAGKSVPTYIGDDGNPAGTAKYGWITKANVDSYTPQY